MISAVQFLPTNHLLMDSGANYIFFPKYDPNTMHSYTPQSPSDKTVKLPNNTSLPIIASAKLGIFPILIVKNLTKPLISESFLTKNYDILIIRYDKTTYIIDAHKAKLANLLNPIDYIIAQAHIADDGLYYLTNLYDLMYATPKLRTSDKTVTFSSNHSIITNNSPNPKRSSKQFTYTSPFANRDWKDTLTSTQCLSNTKTNMQCKNRCVIGNQLCWTHLLAHHNLRIAPSLHGKGLFVKNANSNLPIYKPNQTIIPYGGEPIDLLELHKRYGSGTAPYAVSLNSTATKFIDAALLRGVGSLANHSTTPNARFSIHKGKISLKALQNIYNNDEITVNYLGNDDETNIVNATPSFNFTDHNHSTSASILLDNATSSTQPLPVSINNAQHSNLKGSYRGRFSHLLQPLNPLEILKIRLGFLGTHTLKSIVRHQSVDGLNVQSDELKHLHIGPSLAEYKGRMHAFPTYPSISSNPHTNLCETWSVDDVPMPITSIEGYIGYFSFVEKSTNFRYAIGFSTSIAELPTACHQLIKKFGPRANSKCHQIKVLILDGASTNLGSNLNNFCETVNGANGPIVKRHVSAPYKHEQNLIESHIHHEKNAMRTNLAYNKAPDLMWFKALRYSHKNINITLAPNTKISRQEAMTNCRPDVSHFVPFYAKGYAHVTKPERTNTLSDKAIQVYMIGYGDDLDETTFLPNIQYKQSYQCYIPPNQILIRHDVIFEHLAPHPSLLNDEFKDRFVETFSTSPTQSTQNHSDQRAQHLITYPTISPNTQPTPSENDDQLNESNFRDGDNHRIRTRNDFEPQYWYTHLENSNMLNSAIFNDTELSHQHAPTKSLGIRHQLVQSPKSHLTEWMKSKINPSAPINYLSNHTNLSESYMVPNKNGSIKIHHNTTANHHHSLRTFQNILNDHKRVITNVINSDVSKSTQYLSKPSVYIHNTQATNLQTFIHKNHTNMDLTTPVYNPFTIYTPLTLEEALQLPDAPRWKDAWDEEMTKLQSRSTWKVCTSSKDIPSDQKPIKSKYIFKIKVNPDGSLRYKVRLCACGYSQRYGIDYDETFAPTAKYKSLTTILSLAATHSWELTGIDVENAFVEADIDRPIFMKLPQSTYGNKNGSPVIVELKKSLYGLKQAPELWDKFLVSAIQKQGFSQLMHDQCVFIKRTTHNEIIILIKYVDDIILTGNSQSLIQSTLKEFEHSFTKITHEDNIQRYVGIDLDYNKTTQTIKLSQKPYIKKLLTKFNLPLTPNSPNYSKAPINPTLNYRVLGDNTNPAMRDLTGSLRFLADRTLPNILTACSLLSSAAHNPHDNHRNAGDQILSYLQQHQNDHITLGGDSEIHLFGYADAAHITNHDSKSQLGFCFYLNTTSGAVIAKSKRDTTVSHSSTEAEIKAIDMAIREATWLRGFLLELGFAQDGPTPIFTDNKAALIFSNTNNITDLTAHLVMRINYIHQEQKAGTVKLVWINTENNVADILTKPLSIPLFDQHSLTLMHGHNGHYPQPSSYTKRDAQRKKKINK